MSSALRIAAVTWVLRDLLHEGLINGQLSDAGQVKVTALPPLRNPDEFSGDTSQLNLFLYHLSPNLGWRNAGLPTLDATGTRVASPPLGIDLDYLLTAYDARDFHAEVLLGYALQLLHETPLLSRQAIRASLLRDLEATALPAPLRSLSRSGLADQIEAIKITPQPLGLEEMSKLWSGLQAPYRPSVAYRVTTILIESSHSFRRAAPVLRRGDDGRGPRIQTGRLPFIPTLLAAQPPHHQPCALTHETVHILGRHLAGSDPVVTLRHHRLNLELRVRLEPADLTPVSRPDIAANELSAVAFPPEMLRLADAQFRVNLARAEPAENWAAGSFSLELSVQRPGDARRRTTNTLPLPVAPTLTSGTASRDRDLTVIQVTCHPPVHRGQQVSLIVGQHELRGEPAFEPRQIATSTLQFSGHLPETLFEPTGSPPSPPRHPARLRVDGVEGRFIRFPGTTAPPEFETEPSIVFA